LKSIILLSGGLDSVVSLAVTKQKHNIYYAIFFDYGQKAFDKELKAAQNIAKFYNIPLKILNIDFMKTLQYSKNTDWVPNRNALFINIAACFAETEDIDLVVIGANKEESVKFPDNSKDFINATNQTLKFSTQNKVQVSTPLIDMDKNEIIKLSIQLNVPLNLIFSCYNNKEKHCGVCESCKLLKQALIKNHQEELIKTLFEGH